MVTRRGTLLEKNVEKIFKLFGFRTKRNVHIKGYEIDVQATLDDIKIIVQCKQYESSSLNIRDLIHEWDSKNKFIGADKIIIVIFGQDINMNHKNTAKSLGISIWDESDLDSIEDLAINKKADGLNKFMRIIGMNYRKENNNSKKVSSPMIMFYICLLLIFLSLMFMPLLLISIAGLFASIIWLIVSKNN